MSAPAISTVQPIGLPERTRTLRPLAQPAPRKRPKLVYGIVAVAGAIAIGATQMGLSILTTQSSYEVAALTSEQRALTWDARMLEEEVAGLSSPQNLAANAAALGMVAGQAPNYLSLATGEVSGKGAAAKSSTAVHALSKAAVGNALIAGQPLVTDPSASLQTQTVVVDKALLGGMTAPPPLSDGLPTPDTH